MDILHILKMKIIACILCFSLVNSFDIKGFDDTVLFDIKWAGDQVETELSNRNDYMIVTSVHQEKYKCVLPNILEKEQSATENYKGPLPLELLSPLFSHSSCSFRMESYWTYEICHGKFIRQYHESREGKKVKLQEFYLGRWDKQQYDKQLEEVKASEKETPEKLKNIPIKKIDGINLPYLEIEMSNGTLCDLNNQPRSTKVLYVCYMHGKHEVYSLKETSSCQYEVIVLSPLLCSHPRYKPQDSGENQINCYPLNGSPMRPRSLLEMKIESYKFRQKKLENSEPHVRVEIHPIDVGRDQEETSVPPPESPADTSPVESFLSGKNCLHGGSGWWKYEFCYGKTVSQYHIEKDGSKTSINLGRFDKEKHIDWLDKNPQKRPKPLSQRKQLSHYYSEGTLCDKTGKPRQTVVKLKCLENSSIPGAVSLYLLEPKHCEYVLVVESPLICEILALADENGLVDALENISLEDGVIEDDISEVNKIITS